MNSLPLTELITVDIGDVYLDGQHVAELRRNDMSVEFQYLPDTPLNHRVASTLPVRAEPVVTPGRSVPPYFAGLLPEGRRLTALRTALKTSADDDFSLLLAVGGDAVGNVQVVPHGEPPPPFGSVDDDAAALAEASFVELFERATGRSPDRSALAGVQDKVSGRMITLPLALGDRAAILKLNPPEFPHLVANEMHFLQMAASCGLPTVSAEVVNDRDGIAGLLVTRFDRVRRGEATIARAVEDGCQAAGRYPGDKYALSFETVATTIAALCRARPVALRDVFRQIVFALITGNGDLHAKNLSVVTVGDERNVAPAYDIPSSYPYGDSSLALSIGNSREGQVSRKRLVQFAHDIGLSERAAAMTISDLSDAAEPWVDRVAELPFDERRLHDLRRFMEHRMALLRGG